MTRTIASALVCICLTFAVRTPGYGQAAQPLEPALAGLNQRVSLTAVASTVGRVATELSQQSDLKIVADRRYADLPVSAIGLEGSLAEALSAVCAATQLEARRLDEWIVLSPTRKGIAVLARETRDAQGPQLAVERGELATRREAAVRQAQARLGLGTVEQALAALSQDQFGALNSQGYLTVAQLFPQYYHPLYDYFSRGENRRERPPSLPEFAGARVFFEPTLRLELHVPVADAAATVWPVALIVFPDR